MGKSLRSYMYIEVKKSVSFLFTGILQYIWGDWDQMQLYGLIKIVSGWTFCPGYIHRENGYFQFYSPFRPSRRQGTGRREMEREGRLFWIEWKVKICHKIGCLRDLECSWLIYFLYFSKGNDVSWNLMVLHSRIFWYC